MRARNEGGGALVNIGELMMFLLVPAMFLAGTGGSNAVDLPAIEAGPIQSVSIPDGIGEEAVVKVPATRAVLEQLQAAGIKRIKLEFDEEIQ